MNKFILILLIFVTASCAEKIEESVDFLEPQPVGINNQSVFNKKYQGIYLNTEDSSLLRIEAHTITQSTTDAITFSIRDIDSSIKADRTDAIALGAALSEGYTIKITTIKNDSAYGFISFVDTIFSVSENLCRFYNGSYFLNYANENGIWKVKRLDLNKNKLSVGMIIPTDSLFNIYPVQKKSITKNNTVGADSGVVINYTIAPTKKELKQLVKKDFFTEWEVWIKQ